MKDLNGTPPQTAQKTDMLSGHLSKSNSLIMDLESEKGFVCSMASIHTGNATTSGTTSGLSARFSSRWLCHIFEDSGRSSLNQISQDLILSIVFWLTEKQSMFDCYPGQHTLQISYSLKTSTYGLLNN
ncbi:hypothetical protein TNCV_3244691 [Trichonephila clavipes]|nr:hypothetical protein TNCV_3244691 [Trichonephila clavipes]